MTGHLRVAVDARSLLTSHPRGEGRSLRRLYQEISALRPQWDIRLYGEASHRGQIQNANVAERVLKAPGFRFNTWENVALPFAARAWGAHVLHCTSSSMPRFPLTPAVMTVHDIIPLVFDDGQSARAVDRFRVQLENGFRNAREIIAVSHHTKRDLVTHCNVDPARIRVIHWGIDMADSLPAVFPGSSVVAPEIRTPYFLAFAGDARRKNTETVIRAFAQLPETGPTLVLVGLGNATTRTRYGALAAQLGCANRVVMLGYVDDEMVRYLLGHAIALLYLSLYEGFGLPALEAMAYGVPVIASNATSIPEVVSDSAILIDPLHVNEIADTMSSVIADPRLRTQLIGKGTNRARTFSWQIAAKHTIEVLESAAGIGTSRPTRAPTCTTNFPS
jgi:glycosyltransferase involved in cell wall biosynthesis